MVGAMIFVGVLLMFLTLVIALGLFVPFALVIACLWIGFFKIVATQSSAIVQDIIKTGLFSWQFTIKPVGGMMPFTLRCLFGYNSKAQTVAGISRGQQITVYQLGSVFIHPRLFVRRIVDYALGPGIVSFALSSFLLFSYVQTLARGFDTALPFQLYGNVVVFTVSHIQEENFSEKFDAWLKEYTGTWEKEHNINSKSTQPTN